MDLPPSPLSEEPPTPPKWHEGWLRTIVAALALPIVGYGLTTVTGALLSGMAQYRAVPAFGPVWLPGLLAVGFAFGLAPGVVIGWLDRRRPYAAAAIVPATFGILGPALALPDLAEAAALIGVCLAVWGAASAGIALVRLTFRP
ncbi:MAG: hypothetical protein FJX74_06575 [Armatimonadetes bacterium]|nr:hypothetical protein [Armatimonadota bacterium]